MQKNNLKIFNSPIEVGLRSLIIFAEFSDTDVDLQKLVYLDYFLIHSGDVSGGPDSLHPASPFRSGEIAVKREILKQSLQILHKKNLLSVVPSPEGIKYKICDSGLKFVKKQTGDYAKSLKERAIWLKASFGSMSQSDLDEYVSKNIKSWGAEFLNKV